MAKPELLEFGFKNDVRGNLSDRNVRKKTSGLKSFGK